MGFESLKPTLQGYLHGRVGPSTGRSSGALTRFGTARKRPNTLLALPLVVGARSFVKAYEGSRPPLPDCAQLVGGVQTETATRFKSRTDASTIASVLFAFQDTD